MLSGKTGEAFQQSTAKNASMSDEIVECKGTTWKPEEVGRCTLQA